VRNAGSVSQYGAGNCTVVDAAGAGVANAQVELTSTTKLGLKGSCCM